VFSVKNRPSLAFAVSKETLRAAVDRAVQSTSRVLMGRHENWLENNSPLRTKSSSSTGVGLSHINIACRGANGHFTLTLGDDGLVVCSIVLPAQLIDCKLLHQNVNLAPGHTCDPPKCGVLSPRLDEMPVGSKIMVIDDSTVCSSTSNAPYRSKFSR
jgi:hypothetical protein